MPSTHVIALSATGVLALIAAAVVGASAGTQGPDRNDRPSLPSASRTSAASPGGRPSPGSTGGTGSTGSTGSTGTPGTPGTSGAPPGPPTTPATRSTAPGGPSSTAATPRPSTTATPTQGPPGPGGILTSPGDLPQVVPTSGGASATPPPVTLPPLIGDQTPDAGIAEGRLVEGFPAALAPPEGASIESSSVSVARNMLQATLVLTGLDHQEVVLHYRAVLVPRGFQEQRIKGVEGAPAEAFSRGKDNVTVTTQDALTYVQANLRIDARPG